MLSQQAQRLLNIIKSAEVSIADEDEYLNAIKRVMSLTAPPNLDCYYYLYDFAAHQYQWVSDSVLNVLGYTASFIKNGGINFAINNYFSEEDAKFGSDVLELAFKLLAEIPLEKRPNLVIDHTYRVKHPTKGKIWLRMQTTPTLLSKEGTILLILGFGCGLDNIKSIIRHEYSIKLVDSKGETTILAESHSANNIVKLTKQEINILNHLAKGRTSKQLSEELNISHHTVEAHRRNILQKFGSTSTQEVVAKAINMGLIDLN